MFQPKLVAFKNRQNEIVAYKFDGNKIVCSTGEEIANSANEWRKRTGKGDSLKVNEITAKNWQKAAAQHADYNGFFKRVDACNAESLDFDNLPQPNNSGPTMNEIIRDWAKTGF